LILVMLVLDTNHLRELGYQMVLGQRLSAKLSQRDETAVTAVVCAEEILKGRLAVLASAREGEVQINAYGRLTESIQLLHEQFLLPWDQEAAARFASFRKAGIRIGTSDLRIACIVMEHDATLLTRNTVDFAKVPGLRFENWLD
jgi:tRNA(fMet)-specific endonuclease VapC